MYCKMACIYIRRIMKVLHIYIRDVSIIDIGVLLTDNIAKVR